MYDDMLQYTVVKFYFLALQVDSGVIIIIIIKCIYIAQYRVMQLMLGCDMTSLNAELKGS